MDNSRLRVKASDYELEAEGSRDFVREQYEAFRRLLGDVPGKSAVPQSRETVERSSSPQVPASPLPREKAVAPAKSETKSFQKLLVWDDRTQQMKIMVLPEGPTKVADTVLLLLLGYRELRGTSQVSALDLNQGLRSASFDDLRLDREMAPYLKAKLVLRSGVGKGSRYRLTARGVKQAQELVQSLATLLPDPLP
ncbi:MAG: hypothetical protein F4224_09110 [Nitrospira sp. SB0678_bin_10]|nr:hypothetical protein [Nitrospira sp. SB0678_bin_10]